MPAPKPKNSRHFATWFTLFAALAASASGYDGTRAAIPAVNVATVEHEEQLRPEPELDTLVEALQAEPSQDLLARLRSGFELPAIVNRRVEAELSWFVRHPDYLNRVFTRAQRYMPFIAEEIEARGFARPRCGTVADHSRYGPQIRYSAKLVV
jgi:membrane-bound lytic murein transglycosylase D